jgi:hypothetical protein
MFSLSYFLSYDVFVAEEFLSTAIATNVLQADFRAVKKPECVHRANGK